MMNSNSTTMQKFSRLEPKYLLSLQHAEQFRTGLKPYLVPDEHGPNNGHYRLSSLYHAEELDCHLSCNNPLL